MSAGFAARIDPWVVLAGEPRTSDASTTHLRSRLGEVLETLQAQARNGFPR